MLSPSRRLSRSRSVLGIGRWGGVLAVGFGVGGTDAGAQVATGVLTSAAQGQPIPGAHVMLLAADGSTAAFTVSDPQGRFMLVPDNPGPFVLRAERIGYDLTDHGVIDLPMGDTVRIDYVTTSAPVVLETSWSSEPRACRPADEDPVTDRLWGEARKALRGVWWTGQSQRLVYDATMFERTLRLDDQSVVRDRTSGLRAIEHVPYPGAEPKTLERDGYAKLDGEGRLLYYAPTVASFLSPVFGTTHCFTPVPPAGDRVGLLFVPLQRERTDVEGTIWLDATTLRLQGVDFQYTEEPSGTDHPLVGGSIDFAPVDDRDWILRGWRLRMPAVSPASDGDTAAFTLVGFEEWGGRVTQAVDTAGTPRYTDHATAILAGTIFDSTMMTPLAGGVVGVVGTDVWATTDERGRFYLSGYLDGGYGLVFGHQRLDSLGFVSPPTPVHLTPGVVGSVALAVPSVARILDARCPNLRREPGRRALVGVVRARETREPVADAVVTIDRIGLSPVLERFAATDLDATAVSDSLGGFTVCNVPVGQPLVLSAFVRGAVSDFVRVVFDADVVRYGDGRQVTLEHPIARLDLEVLSTAERTTRLSGVVTSVGTGSPVDGATVTFEGTGLSARTDSAGAFDIMGLPAGELRFTVQKLGFRPLRYRIGMLEDQPVALPPNTLALEPVGSDVTTLAPIVVEASPVTREMAGFDERRRMGFGSFVTRGDIEDWKPLLATDVLRRMRGIRVRPNPQYGSNGDTRRFLLEASRDAGFRVTNVLPVDANRLSERATTLSDRIITECPVLLFVNGLFIGDSRTADVDNFVTPTDLAGVEVYSASQVPARFALPGATCGVAVFWTR